MKLFSNIKITKRNLYETGFILLAADLFWMMVDFQLLQITLGFVLVAIGLLIPKVFCPIAWVLLAAGTVLSMFIPKILLSLVFFTVVTPVAFLRRIRGVDNLQLRAFTKDTNSVFTERNKTIEPKDIINPY